MSFSTARVECGVELSLKLPSVPVVILHLNGLTTDDLPPGIEVVEESGRDEQPGAEGGRRVDEDKGVNTSSLLKELSSRGFRPMRIFAVRRKNRRFRIVVVFVHWRHAKREEEPLSGRARRHLQEMLTFLHDVRIYRNPSRGGGNFILDCGNPKKGSSDIALGVNEAEEFEFFDEGDS
jgi:hypothetical protein